jgi:glycerol uptake facilitator-like aquaporin
MYKYLVEFLGSIVFVYVFLATNNPLAIGATLCLLILLTSGISGGHINPTVSIVMTAAGKLPSNDLIPYIICQTFGGLFAFELFKRVQV